VSNNSDNQTPNIHQFLGEKVLNVLALYNQNTTLGTTHVLYTKATTDFILADLKNIYTTLQNLGNPPPVQKTPPKESKIAPPPITK